VDLLDAEPEKPSHSARWLMRLLGVAASIALAITVVPRLLGSLQPVRDGSPASSVSPHADQHAEAAPTLPSDMHTASRIVLAADRLDILDIDGGDTLTLPLPATYRSSRSGALLRASETTVLLAAPPRTNAYEFNLQAFAVADDGQTTDLGIASQLLSATEDAVWLVQRRGGLPTIRLVGVDGAERMPPRTLPADARVVGRVHLSGDGRHWSVAAAASSTPDRRSIMIGHLPGTPDAEEITTVADVPAIGRSSGPRMSWSPSGWLFVSTGYDLWAVSPDPHQAFALEANDHHGIAAG
jgi:hypothetical protein